MTVIGTLPITVLHVTVLLALFVPVLFGGCAVWQIRAIWKQECKEGDLLPRLYSRSKFTS